MPDYYVILEAGWIVKDVKTVEDAMNVAVAEAGKRLNPDKSYVEVAVGTTPCPICGEPFDSVFLAGNIALVGLLLEIKVYNAENEEHAKRIAKKEIGKALKDISLKVIEVEEIKH
jgi:uncharacterized protein (UPF0212 family)